MTSILEALREIEEERKRTHHPTTVSVTDAPPPPPSSSGMVYPSIAGLAVGVLCVGALAWWAGVGTAPAPEPSTIAPPDASHTVTSPPPAAPDATTTQAAEALDWLDRMEAPQARVANITGATAPVPSAPDAARPPAEAPSVDVAPPAPTAGAPAGNVRVEAIRYAAAPEQRSVTLRLDGRRVTLRQGGRAAGVEVQLILEDGAYLNRGSEVFFASPGG